MTGMDPERRRDIAAMNARTYAMTKPDCEQWYRDHPASSFGTSEPGGEMVTEHAHRMSGGEYHLWNTEPYIEMVYPLEQRIVNEQQHGKVWRRKIVVIEDWHEVPPASAANGDAAA